MWGPILANLFQIIFSIFGIFGSWQYKSSYIAAYMLWTLFWFAWNCFITCYYLNIGILNKDWDILSLGTGSVSWWEANGPGCKALFLPNQSNTDTQPWHPLKPDLITGCAIPYHHLEAAQAIIHAILAIVGLYLGFSVNSTIKNGEEAVPSNFKKSNTTPLFPVDLMPRLPINNSAGTESSEEPDNRAAGAKPMTPRRVKRRSISRGSMPPQMYTGTNAPMNSFPRRHSHSRSSTRSSGRRPRSNPVSRLIDQQESAARSMGHTNLMFQHSPENSFSYEPERPPSARSSYSNYHGTRAQSYRHSHNFLVSGPPGYSSQSETAI
ncbi:uncharacterized protein LOC106670360 isoform X2 [Cimex lectularius]|nr:uncharacterized protein LOC106670360 isoform X2 [Cimex lectularius]